MGYFSERGGPDINCPPSPISLNPVFIHKKAGVVVPLDAGSLLLSSDHFHGANIECPIASPRDRIGDFGKLKYSSGGIILEELESFHRHYVDRAPRVISQPGYHLRAAMESSVKMIF